MSMTKEAFIISLLMAILVAPATCAEDIQTYGGCDICPGQIHYGPDEAREILGPEGLKLVSKLRKNKAIKIDLDGVLENGLQEDNDKGYELIISSGQSVLDVKDIHDKSFLLIVTDHLRAQQAEALDRWYPEIYLQSRLSDKINRDDSLTLAWDRFEKSNICQWVGLEEDKIGWRLLLRHKVLQAIELMGDE
jgi:hypothetical protein